MERRPAYWTHDDEAADEIGEHMYYFAPSTRATTMRVLVCGGRNYCDSDAVWSALDAILQSTNHDCMTVIQGGARGADQLAVAWCLDHSVPYDNYAPDWTKHGTTAGPMRNQRMIDEGKPDLVLAFPGGKGTADIVRRAAAAGIKVAAHLKSGA